MTWQGHAFALAAVTALLSPSAARAEGAKKIELTPLDKEPKDGREKPTAERIATLKKEVEDAPKDRQKRFELVRAMMAAGDLEGALAAAKAWREKDAYNLVVVRLLGDIYTELGDKEQARRTYSAIVELLPKDVESQRALATVLKQGGDLQGAYDRLSAAMKIKPDDVRMAFELADVAQRLGHADESIEGFERIVANGTTSEAVRYPAKQRLAQAYAQKRREALARHDDAAAALLEKKIDALAIHGGVVNHIKVYLTWDTDRSDIDLWVENPASEKVFYGHKTGASGDALFDDVTTGYGPESYTAKNAQNGVYTIKVNYFSSRRSAFNEARGEVVVILHEGTADEERHVLPYRLFQDKQTVTVAKIGVAR
jgi:tetratricopeptide (TPR) repeat protein